MENILDVFASEVRRKRKQKRMTQKQLAEKLHMSSRTILDLENYRSTPKSETVLLVAKELNISVDALLFPEIKNVHVSKTVADFFADKTESEAQQYIAFCQQIDLLKNNQLVLQVQSK